MQTTDHLLMIRPANFYFNTQTAVNNSFQVAATDGSTAYKAAEEFDDFVQKLISAGINVTVIQDSPEPSTPDSVFPNNWISFHEPGTIILYPMFAENRRLERKATVLETLQQKFSIKHVIDFTGKEHSNIFLEGTGSMVLDRTNKIAYACLSPRTDKQLFEQWCLEMNYTACSFIATDSNKKLIYHTNVMMCIADRYAVICPECIADKEEREQVLQTITHSGKEVIAICQEQVNHFAGNMLQVKNKTGQLFLIMSTQAFESLNESQIEVIQSYNPIIHSSLTTIETNGGGSARCMMAEIFV